MKNLCLRTATLIRNYKLASITETNLICFFSSTKYSQL